MKRSEINALIRSAHACFAAHGWALPPEPRWDVSDFGLADWKHFGLVLVNLAEEPEYCEKLMYAQQGMTTPAHTHHVKKEDIIARWGTLSIQLWNGEPATSVGTPLTVNVNGQPRQMRSGDVLNLLAGNRVTLLPGMYHEFAPATPECIIGEVSTANDDMNDNIFVRNDIGRFPQVDEDEPALVKLVSDR